MSPSHAETYTLSLHDALPIFEIRRGFIAARGLRVAGRPFVNDRSPVIVAAVFHPQRIENVFFQHLLVRFARDLLDDGRSEEHTSELQSRGHLVCRLLLEKKTT